MIEPLFDYVLIEKDEEVKTTAGGLVIPDSQKEKPSSGTVIRTGTGTYENGVSVPMTVFPEERVLFPKGAGRTVKEDDKEYLIMRQTELLGKIK